MSAPSATSSGSRAGGREEGFMPRMSSEAFRHDNEILDEELFKTLRPVTHSDDLTITTVTQLYRKLLPPGADILDLMDRVRTSGRAKIGTCLLYSGRSLRAVAPDIRVG